MSGVKMSGVTNERGQVLQSRICAFDHGCLIAGPSFDGCLIARPDHQAFLLGENREH